MIGRYSVLTAIVVVVALVTGVIVHVVSGTTTYKAVCQFQLALPATAASTNVASSDVLAYNRRVVKDEIARVPTRPILDAAAKKTGISPATIAASQLVVPASDSTVAVVATYSNWAKTIALANVLCRNYVSQVRKQMQADFTSESRQLRNRLRSLLAQQRALGRAAKRSATPLAFHQNDYLNQAITRAKQFLAVTYGSPQFSVSLLQPALSAETHSTKPSLAKSLIVSAAAGLLLSFLLILLLETLRGRNEELVPAHGSTNGPLTGTGTPLGPTPPPPAPRARARAATREDETVEPVVPRPVATSPAAPAPDVPDARASDGHAGGPNGSHAERPAPTSLAPPTPSGDRPEPEAMQTGPGTGARAATAERVVARPAAAPKAEVTAAPQDVPRPSPSPSPSRSAPDSSPASTAPDSARAASAPDSAPASGAISGPQAVARGVVLTVVFLAILSVPLFVTQRTTCSGHARFQQYWSVVAPFSGSGADQGCRSESGATVLLKAVGVE